MFVNGIFEGGGIKGLAYIGSAHFLQSRGINFFRCGGSSVGAIIASLFAVGYSANELWSIVEQIEVGNLKTSVGIKKAIKTKGLYTIEALEELLEELNSKKGKRYFSDVKYGEDYLLKIIVSDFTNKQMVVIPNDLKKYGINPDTFSIAKAAAMSSSIPLFYQPYKIGKNVFYDGGMTNNFPFFLFKKSDQYIDTIGFKVHGENENKVILNTAKKIFFKAESPTNYSDNFSSDNIIHIDTSFVKTTDFKKGIAYKTHLYDAGYNAAQQFFYRHLLNNTN